MISRKQKRLRHDHGGAAGLHFPARCLLQTGKRTCGPPGLQIIIRSMHTKMDAETASMASTAVCASEQAEAAQKVCAERVVWSCIVVRAIVHASFLLRCSDFSAAGGIFQVINFIKLSPGPAKKLGDSAGNRPGSRFRRRYTGYLEYKSKHSIKTSSTAFASRRGMFFRLLQHPSNVPHQQLPLQLLGLRADQMLLE